MNNTKKHGVQNYTTGIVEAKFDTLCEAANEVHRLNGKYSNAREDQKEYRVVYISDEGKIYDSEYDYINS